MKICIPSRDDRGLESEIHAHFGSAPWFTIVDTQTGEIQSLENPSCHTARGDCHHVGVLARHGVDAVMSSGIGRRAWAGLKDAGIEVYAGPGATVWDVVALVKNGEARPIELGDACHGGGAHDHGRHRHHGSGCDH